MRFFFPPHKKANGEEQVTEWGVSIRAESLMEDPSKLFLEADAEWFESGVWDTETPLKLIKNLSTTQHYLENNVVNFLKRSADDLGDDEPGKNDDHD